MSVRMIPILGINGYFECKFKKFVHQTNMNRFIYFDDSNSSC